VKASVIVNEKEANWESACKPGTVNSSHQRADAQEKALSISLKEAARKRKIESNGGVHKMRSCFE